MQFPNAYAGIKDIYISVILTIVAVGLSIITIIGMLAGSTITGILAVLAILVSIVAFVSYIVGIVKASRDEEAFKKALYALLASIVVSLLGNFIRGALLSGIFNVLSGVCSFLITYMICQGIVNLADRLGDAAVAAAGRTVMKLELIVWIISIVVSLVSAILGESVSGPGGILSIVSSIFTIVAYILYIGLLGKAKQMLA